MENTVMLPSSFFRHYTTSKTIQPNNVEIALDPVQAGDDEPRLTTQAIMKPVFANLTLGALLRRASAADGCPSRIVWPEAKKCNIIAFCAEHQVSFHSKPTPELAVQLAIALNVPTEYGVAVYRRLLTSVLTWLDANIRAQKLPCALARADNCNEHCVKWFNHTRDWKVQHESKVKPGQFFSMVTERSVTLRPLRLRQNDNKVGTKSIVDGACSLLAARGLWDTDSTACSTSASVCETNIPKGGIAAVTAPYDGLRAVPTAQAVRSYPLADERYPRAKVGKFPAFEDQLSSHEDHESYSSHDSKASSISIEKVKNRETLDHASDDQRRDILKQLQEKPGIVDNKIRSTISTADDAGAEAKGVQPTVERISNQVEEATRNMDVTEARVAQLQSTMAAVAGQVSQIRDRASEPKDRILQLQSTVAVVADRVRGVSNEIAQYQTHTKRLEIEVMKLRQQMSALDDKVENHENELQSLHEILKRFHTKAGMV